MEMIPEPLIILSLVIGSLNLIERLLRRTNKYKRLREKVCKSKERLIAISEHQLSTYENSKDDEGLLMDALELIDEIQDYTDIGFEVPI